MSDPLSAEKHELLHEGLVIPAHPLALTSDRKLDERHQRALTRYYLAAGAGGVAVGVHTTQFAIRDPEVGLFKPVLQLAAEEVTAHWARTEQPVLLIGGVCGRTEQATKEAETLLEYGYDAGLLSMSAFREASVDEMIAHAEAVAAIIPVFGFYLQPSVGGRVLPFEFWRRFAEIDNVIAIKMAPFNRYQTFDVVRAVAEAGRHNDIALYTGNDDNILADLLTPYQVRVGDDTVACHIVGGLLGHWAVWTKKAVELLDMARDLRKTGGPVPLELLTRNIEITDANAAFFDAANGYHGVIAGIHEVLVRQGLLAGRWCLDPNEDLSPGQKEEIARVYAAYPHLNDDAFVAEHLDEWLG